MSYEIEKNVPIEGKKRLSKYPFDKMEVGDSFLVPKEDYNNIHSMRAALFYTIKKVDPNMKISTRTVEGGIRVWRIK